MNDWDRFNSQFAEDEDERRERLRRKRHADAFDCARRLAVALWEKHYKDEAPNWRPAPTLTEIILQIDNMTTGLVRPGK